MTSIACSLHPFRRAIGSRRFSGFAVAALAALSPVSSFSSSSAVTGRARSKSSFFEANVVPQQHFYSTSTAATSPMLSVAQFPCLSTNYGFLLHDPVSGHTAAIDVPDAQTYQEELNRRGWTLSHIFNTHHHHDHTGGNLELKELGNVKIVGPRNESAKIPGIDTCVGDGDEFEFGGSKVIVMDAGGHTKGHISFYFPAMEAAFVGDCLFSLGCGRMFEGTATQFWTSLERLRELPDKTSIYCAHEYTSSNAEFALSVEPNNHELVRRAEIVKSQRERDESTIPTLLGEEKKTNPFLRVDFSDEIRANVGATKNDTPAEAFAKLRKAKDNF